MSDSSSHPWSAHLRPTLADLSVYDVAPAGPSWARMHANECPEPWPDEVGDALAELIRTIELGRYPDTSGRSLRRVLADRYGTQPGRIILGNGSDEIIFILLTALSGGTTPGAVVFPTPTFVMYGHTARVLGMPIREVPVDENFQLRESAMDEALQGAAVCFLARPNNPTGVLWDAEIIGRLNARHPGTIFVVDEAYGAYAPGASLWNPGAPPNQVHMATLSKVGFAALRVGYCIAHPDLAAELDKVRHPYNLSATSLAMAELLLTRFDAQRRAMVARVIANRDRLSEMLGSLHGCRVYPSAANLVMARFEPHARASELAAQLAERGILVKDFSAKPGLEGCLRVSVGTSAELDRLQDALRHIGELS